MRGRNPKRCEMCRFWSATSKGGFGATVDRSLRGYCRLHQMATRDSGHCGSHEVATRPVAVTGRAVAA